MAAFSSFSCCKSWNIIIIISFKLIPPLTPKARADWSPHRHHASAIFFGAQERPPRPPKPPRPGEPSRAPSRLVEGPGAHLMARPGSPVPAAAPPPRGPPRQPGPEGRKAEQRRAPSCRGRSGARPAPCSACRGGPGPSALAAADRAERSPAEPPPQPSAPLASAMAGELVLLLLLLPPRARLCRPPRGSSPAGASPMAPSPQPRRGQRCRLPAAVTSIPVACRNIPSHPLPPPCRGSPLSSCRRGASRQPPPCCRAAVHLGLAASAPPVPSAPPSPPSFLFCPQPLQILPGCVPRLQPVRGRGRGPLPGGPAWAASA